MDVSKEKIKRLRDKTGAGFKDCKDALETAEGDLDKAVEIVREKGMIIAEKKADRDTGAGILEAYVHNNRVGVLLDLRAETDFVVKSDPFQKLSKELAMQIAAMGAEETEELLEQDYIRDPKKTIEELIKETIAEVGENIEVNKFCRYEI